MNEPKGYALLIKRDFENGTAEIGGAVVFDDDGLLVGGTHGHLPLDVMEKLIESAQLAGVRREEMVITERVGIAALIWGDFDVKPRFEEIIIGMATSAAKALIAVVEQLPDNMDELADLLGPVRK